MKLHGIRLCPLLQTVTPVRKCALTGQYWHLSIFLRVKTKQRCLQLFQLFVTNKQILFLISFKVFDEAALSTTVAEEMEKCFPEARFAHLKSGGNFPFLSRADEVNVLIRVRANDVA